MNKNSITFRVLDALKHLVITTFLALILYFFTIPITTRLSWVAPVMQMLLIIMFTCSMYIPFWEYGDRDSNLVQFGRKRKDMLCGLKISGVAVLPHFIASLFLLFYRLGAKSWTFLIYRTVNVQFVYIIDSLIDVENISAVSWGSVILCMMLCFYTVVVAEIGYILGYKGISIKEKIVYKSKK